eukprot:14273984-Alexandrium_andersonii.AAC.1
METGVGSQERPGGPSVRGLLAAGPQEGSGGPSLRALPGPQEAADLIRALFAAGASPGGRGRR